MMCRPNFIAIGAPIPYGGYAGGWPRFVCLAMLEGKIS